MHPDGQEPSRIEALGVMFFALIIELLLVAGHGSFWMASGSWLDNENYTNITLVLLGRKTASSLTEHHFWGLPYFMAGVSAATSASIQFSLSAISVAAALCTCALIHRLYGGWVAIVFAAVSIEWLRLSLLGGSEPLFMCLLLASFLAVRSDRLVVATLIAAIATTVRPVGIIVLVSIAGILVARRRWKALLLSSFLTCGIAGLYLLPIYLLTGDPMISFERYRDDWGASRFPLALPFTSMIHSYKDFIQTRTWAGWVGYVTWPIILMGLTAFIVSSKPRSRVLNENPVETLFVALYLAFLVSYNFKIAWHFPRFVIPVVPTLLFWMKDFLPKNRLLIYPAVVLSAVLAGV